LQYNQIVKVHVPLYDPFNKSFCFSGKCIFN